MTSSRPHCNTQLLEPRRQVALPDSPPLTPPQFKDQFGEASTLSALRGDAPLSINTTSTFDRADRGPLSPEDIPKQQGNPGLGLGFSQTSEKTSSAYEFESHPMSLSVPMSLRGGIARRALSSGRAMFPRVPRRIRPALLLATSLLAIVVFCLTRSVGATPQPATAGPFGRRTPPAEALFDINDERVDEYHQAQEAVFEHRLAPAPRPSPRAITFASKRDELLTLIGFITAATGNSLPNHVDPSETIDMSVLVGFDPAASGAADDLDLLKDEVNAQYPLVLFGRMRDPWHQEVVHLLEQWKIVPEPLVVEVDQRRDTATFEPVLERLFGNDDLPQLVLNGRSLGGAQEVLGMEPEELRARLEKSGMTVMELKKKKKGALQAERDRQHRLLRPKPIDGY